MLQYLYIENFAIADKVEINFNEKYNVITGETGAGKTIIINALSLLLGERADIDIIRKGNASALIRAVFRVDEEVESILKKNKIIPKNREVTLERIIHRERRNKVFINKNRVPLKLVRKIMAKLVDLNNQNAHQMLMDPSNHLSFIDFYGDYNLLLDKYSNKFQHLKNMTERYEKYKNNKKELKRRLDNLKYEYNEISKVEPKIGEDEDLTEEIQMLERAKDIIMSGNFIHNLTEENEVFEDIMNSLFENLNNLKNVNDQMDRFVKEIEEGIEQFMSSSEELKFYIDDMELDENRLQKLNMRLNKIEKLKNKYGDSIEEILDYRKKIKNEIDEIEETSFDFEKIKKEIEKLEKELIVIAEEIEQKRKGVSKEFSKKIEKELSFLSMDKASFEVKFYKNNEGLKINGNYYDSNGRNNIEFYIETNTGEGFYPLVSIASGGELSRILFSIKSVLSHKYDVTLLIFDEIDSGIGGEISKKMAKKLITLADQFQLIVITHQPQIAAASDNHLYVEKREFNNRTVSRVRKLNEKEHITEVARMIAGENINDHIIETAKTMCLGLK